MDIYKRIKSLREQLKMTQEELAHKTGYKTRSAINKIESGDRDINQSQIADFARALGVTPAYLMGWEDDTNDINYKNMINIPSYDELNDRLEVREASAKLQLPNTLFNDNCNYFYLFMPDDSMIMENIHKNDLLIFNDHTKIKNGNTGLLEIQNKLIIRKFFIDKNSQTITLLAYDGHTPPLSFKSHDEFTVIGILNYVLEKK
ncbi:MAG: helix-turn-helix domain-containing protein [Erysipelotrichia bacterium]|nr:helix-turn-helix domain-containing protein [Erysipelotrichia bacterium]